MTTWPSPAPTAVICAKVADGNEAAATAATTPCNVRLMNNLPWARTPKRRPPLQSGAERGT